MSRRSHLNRLCLCIGKGTPNAWRTLMEGESLVELRCDLMGLEEELLGELVPLAERVIVTCHDGQESCRERLYRKAIEARVWAVDIALDMPQGLRERLIESAHNGGVRVILSHHFPHTPPLEELIHTTRQALNLGADIAKIITTAHTTAEALIPLGLYDHFDGERLVAFAMGTAGRFTRRTSLLLGAHHTYVAPSEGLPTAAGQPTKEEMEGELSATYPLEACSLPEVITPPSSKSQAQRAIVLAALASGTTQLDNFTLCGDSQSALSLVESLGARVTLDDRRVTIEGIGREGMSTALAHIQRLHVGESALLARLTMPLAAMLLTPGRSIEIEAEGTLLRRPMDSTLRSLSELGAEVDVAAATLPIELGGGLRLGRAITIEGSHSSQFISGVMIAATLATKPTTIEITNAVSRPYLHLTAESLREFGAEVEILESADQSRGMSIRIAPATLRGRRLTLQTDWSAAGYFAAAFAIAQSGFGVRERYTLCAQRGTRQADEQILQLLIDSGAVVEEDTEGIHLLPSAPLRGFEFDATDAPDLIPTLAVVALYASGYSHIGGIGRLAGKESNRTEALLETLLALGAEVAIEGDRMVIRGGCRLHAAPLATHSDHRIAMAQAIIGLFMSERPRLDDVACVAKSFPTFFSILKQ